MKTNRYQFFFFLMIYFALLVLLYTFIHILIIRELSSLFGLFF